MRKRYRSLFSRTEMLLKKAWSENCRRILRTGHLHSQRSRSRTIAKAPYTAQPWAFPFDSETLDYLQSTGPPTNRSRCLSLLQRQSLFRTDPRSIQSFSDNSNRSHTVAHTVAEPSARRSCRRCARQNQSFTNVVEALRRKTCGSQQRATLSIFPAAPVVIPQHQLHQYFNPSLMLARVGSRKAATRPASETGGKTTSARLQGVTDDLAAAAHAGLEKLKVHVGRLRLHYRDGHKRPASGCEGRRHYGQ